MAVLADWLAHSRPTHVVIGSVGRPDYGFMHELGRIAPVVEARGDMPLGTLYATPGTLGVDRLANAVGARAMFPGRPVLVFDLGTCITADLVDTGGTHLGGTISPGLRMRARAMHAYSARLPEVQPPELVPLVGRDTDQSLASGIVHGIRWELAGMIAETAYEHPGLAVVLTGGDAPRFMRALKSGIFADPLLTLRGLHGILQHTLADGTAAAGR
jgi:type III pantothenate kinase